MWYRTSWAYTKTETRSRGTNTPRFVLLEGRLGPKLTRGDGGGPGEPVVSRVVGVVQPELIFGTRQTLTELDHVSNVSGGDRGIGRRDAMGREVVQAVHPILIQVTRNLNGKICSQTALQKKENNTIILLLSNA